MMTETTSPSTIEDFTEVMLRLFPLRPRFQVLLPDDLAKFKAQLAQAHPNGPAGPGEQSLLYHVCVVLARGPEPMTMGELSRSLDVPLSTATRIVDWLVKSKFVERQPDPADRRIVRVALTEHGQAMFQALNTFIRQRVAHLLHFFTPEEQASLVALMRKLITALEND